jgi:hypothetical protein
MTQVQWLLMNKHEIVAAYADTRLMENWAEISRQVEATWERCCPAGDERRPVGKHLGLGFSGGSCLRPALS